MRKQLKDYIIENVHIGNTSYDEKEVDEFLEVWYKVEKDCKPFLKELDRCKGKWLLRGIRGGNYDLELKKRRSDREPKDTKLELHQAFDKVFYDKFGWKPRKEGVFCSGNLSTAGSYGTTYIIFPTGNYKYLWSDYIGDLYGHTEDWAQEEGPSDDEIDEWREEYDETYGENGEGEWLYDGNGTGCTDRDDAVDSVLKDLYDSYVDDFEGEEEDDEPLNFDDWARHERHSVGSDMEWQPEEEWSTFRADKWDNWTPQYSDYEEMAKKAIDDGNYQKRDLCKALNKVGGTEVMVDCDSYYCFDYVKWKDILERVFYEDTSPDQLTFDFGKK